MQTELIVDSHCHAGKGEGLAGPWDTAAPLDKYLQRAMQAGIDHTVLFAAFHSDYAVANREVARALALPVQAGNNVLLLIGRQETFKEMVRVIRTANSSDRYTCDSQQHHRSRWIIAPLEGARDQYGLRIRNEDV